MSFLQDIVLGIVQGLTEFLPISSTAHLRIVPAFFGWDDPGAAFTAVTQLGTMMAVVIYFRDDLWRIATTWLRSLRDPSLRSELDARFGWYIIVGTIPIGIFGLIFKDQIETGARSLYLIGSTLIVFGFVLLWADRVGRRDRKVEQITTKDGLTVGFAQALALVPGRVALGRDDHGRPVPRPRARGGGAVLVPALDPRGRPERVVRAAVLRLATGVAPAAAAPPGSRSRRCSRSSWATSRSPSCCAT